MRPSKLSCSGRRWLSLVTLLSGACLGACSSLVGFDELTGGAASSADASDHSEATSPDAGADSGAEAGADGSVEGAVDGGASLSCIGLAATCGPSANGDCCASSAVPGGTYERSSDAGYPATVTDFRLDTYEVTVGRFRRFVADYAPDMIAQGSGKNANNPSDPGWDSAWNASLPANAGALASAVKCEGSYTWTDAPAANENRPMNCVTWFEAEAFCTWDGGRLPTEAEWQYAAGGGSEERTYPWGSAVPGADANLAVYGCHYSGTGTCIGVAAIAPVGRVSAGNARWGHADMGGNLSEWVQDWLVIPYASTPCNDCANLTATPDRGIRGGSFGGSAAGLAVRARGGLAPSNRGIYSTNGFRCARAAP